MKNELILVMGLALMVCLSSIAYAGNEMNLVTYNSPANKTAVGGSSVTFNATAQNATDVAFLYSSGGNYLGVLCTAKASTANSTAFAFTCSADLTGITDGLYNITVNASRYNMTGTSAGRVVENSTIATTNATVEFDSTAPTVNLNVPILTVKYGRPILYECTTSDAYNASYYKNVTFYDPAGTQKYSTTTAAKVAQDEIDPQYVETYGTYIIRCLAKDAVSTTAVNVSVDVNKYDGRNTAIATVVTQSVKQSNNTTLLAVGLFFVLLVGGAGAVIISSKKRKGKKRK